MVTAGASVAKTLTRKKPDFIRKMSLVIWRFEKSCDDSIDQI
jgi:hypothetical protein